MSNKLTQANVRAQLRDLGISFTSKPATGEFCVGGSYYTDSLEDALDTGKALAHLAAQRQEAAFRNFVQQLDPQTYSQLRDSYYQAAAGLASLSAALVALKKLPAQQAHVAAALAAFNRCKLGAVL